MSVRYTLVTDERLFNANLESHFLYPLFTVRFKWQVNTPNCHKSYTFLFQSELKNVSGLILFRYMNWCHVWTRKVKLIYEKLERYTQFFSYLECAFKDHVLPFVLVNWHLKILFQILIENSNMQYNWFMKKHKICHYNEESSRCYGLKWSLRIILQ